MSGLSGVLGAHMTALAMDAAKAAGCQEAVLQSSPEAVGVYRRLGFVERGANVCYYREAAAQPPLTEVK